MPNEETAALMRQWTAFEPTMLEVVGDEKQIVSRLDSLIAKYSGERAKLSDPKQQQRGLPALHETRDRDSLRAA